LLWRIKSDISIEPGTVIKGLNGHLGWVIGQLGRNHCDWEFSRNRVRGTKDDPRMNANILPLPLRFGFIFARPDAHNFSMFERRRFLLRRWSSESRHDEQSKEVYREMHDNLRDCVVE